MTKNRPLSPHLQIYKPQITSVMSILHRITGMILCTSVIGIIIWLIALSSSEQCFYAHQGFYQTTLGKLILWMWLTNFYYHLCNGIRHLCWDFGFGFDIKIVENTGMTAAIITLILSLLTLVALF